MVRWVKLVFALSALHMYTCSNVVAPLLIQHPTNVPGRAAGDDSCVWISVTYVQDLDAVPGSCFELDPTVTVVTIWKLMEDLFLSVTYPSNNWINLLKCWRILMANILNEHTCKNLQLNPSIVKSAIH